MPLDAVTRAYYPVVLIREIEKLTGNAAALQGVKGRKSLFKRHAVVFLSVDHQHRRLPLVDIPRRVVLLVAARIGIVRATMLPLWKPQLLRRVIHRTHVKDAVVIHQALEAVGPISGNPVHHVPTVGSTKRANILAGHPGIPFQCGGEPCLQILERLPAPITSDGIGERLSVPHRTMKIDHHCRVTSGRIALGVPAVMEMIAE